ncbi:winged helix-turn-helix transcriptional regulator [Reyranella sp.]|uniref:winged helix-turn-helix transcriptional regulator n=1 Tax=Reyranella sp. TaxID=1929291 RepID=UPI003D105D16
MATKSLTHWRAVPAGSGGAIAGAPGGTLVPAAICAAFTWNDPVSQTGGDSDPLRRTRLGRPDCTASARAYTLAMRRTSYEQLNCSIASALDVVGEPWTLLIVRDAFYGVRRFDDFQENLGIARNVLTARLKKLVEAGVFRKSAYRQRPLRHEYRLTDKGAALFTVIVGLKQWGDRFGPAAKNGKPMDLVDRADGHALEPALIDVLTGRRLELTNVRAVAGPGAVQATRDFFDRLTLTRPSQR